MRFLSSLLLLALLPHQQPDGVIRSTTRLVQVSVVVKDKDGKPVMGLTKDDFALTDNGKDQKITLFSVETNTPASDKNAPKLPPGTLTNRVAGSAGIPRNLTVILIDSVNTRPQDWAQAYPHLMKFLQQIDSTDHVALYTYGTKLLRVLDFTNDSAALAAALGRVKIQQSHVGTEAFPEPGIAGADAGDQLGNVLAAMQASANDITQSMADFATAERARQSLRAIEALVGSVSGIPGRKSLIWVAGDFPIKIGYSDAGVDPIYRNIKEDMDRAARAINGANVAVYPVDAGGLLGVATRADDRDATAQKGAVSGARRPNTGVGAGDGLAERISGAASQDPAMRMHSAMIELADRTGGRAFYNTNDINTAVRQAANDSKVTYMLSFAPTHDQWNGNFRELKIKVNRPGTQVLYRKGYLAVPDQPTDQQTRRQGLAAAAASPFIASGIGLKIRPVQTENVMQMNIEIDIHEIGFELKNGKHEALVDLLFVFRNAAGQPIDQIHQPADLSLSPEDYKKLEPTGIGLSLPLPIPAGTTKIRVIARDNASGQVGSLDVPVKN